MNDFIISYQKEIRLIAFFGIFTLMALIEAFKPYRKLTQNKWSRWRTNLGIVIMNTVIVGLVFPMTAVKLSEFCQNNQIGIFNFIDFFSTLHPILILLASFIILDFFIYIQHLIFHATPILWRLHRVHHVDLDYDVTTGARFHTIEILLSMLIKFGVIIFLGPSPEGVIIFEVLLNGCAMFNHSNIQLPTSIDFYLRRVLVTPNMHRIHHSVEENETNSNFGFCLPFWDFIFGSHMWEAKKPDPEFEIGLKSPRDEKNCVSFLGILALPFKGKVTNYALNKRNYK